MLLLLTHANTMGIGLETMDRLVVLRTAGTPIRCRRRQIGWLERWVLRDILNYDETIPPGTSRKAFYNTLPLWSRELPNDLLRGRVLYTYL